ncbi:MAG: hypothetical protein AAGH46_07495 [Bacteroidota bacterium]
MENQVNFRMKQIISILIGTIYFHIGFSQGMPVTDVGTTTAVTVNNGLAKTNIAKNTAILTKATAILNTLSNMKTEYDKWSANIEEISNVIEVGRDVTRIGSCLDDIKKTYKTSLNIIKNSYLLNNKDKEKILFVYSKLMKDCISTTSESIDVITDGTYKMNDSERLVFLKESHRTLSKKLSLMRYMNQKIQHAEKKALTNQLNNDILNGNALKINR